MRSSSCSFNPRPPSLASGATSCRPRCARSNSFNPRPPSLASGAGQRAGGLQAAVVSIHARHRWRAVHRPDGPRARGRQVSIHARHRWRAVPGTALEHALLLAQFQSTPAIAGERCGDTRAVQPKPAQFQSTPAIAGERCYTAHHRWRVSARFNPRPPSLASGAPSGPVKVTGTGAFQSTPAIAGERCGERCGGRGGHRVSIHARHRWRAVLLAGGGEPFLQRVSIHARHRWRAVPRHRGPCDPAHVVSIHARHRWRAVP